MSEFLGARISLISKSDIRYVGTLHEINSDASTVSLENVHSFGTEGRKGANVEEEVAPSEQVYEYIVFRGSDVKDLRIEQGPGPIKENEPPAMPNDPAIVGARPRPNKAPGPPPQHQHGPPGGPPTGAPTGIPGGPPGAPGFGYFPPHMGGGGWGRGNVPGPNAFGGMPYPPPPPPPQWFTPGQEFGPMGGPAPWGNYPFPSGPGAPPGIPGQPGRPMPNNQQVPNSQTPTQSGGMPKPAPIGSAAEIQPSMAAQTEKTAEPKTLVQQPAELSAAQPVKPVGQRSNQKTAPSGPPPPVDSKPSVEEVKAKAASLANASNKLPQAATQDSSKTVPTGPKVNRPTQILPAVPLPAALTAKHAQQPPNPASKAVSDATSQAALRDATEAAKAAVALAMAKLQNPQAAHQPVNGNNVDNLTKKVNEMRVNARQGPGGNNARGGRGRGPRPAKVDVPDADFDFATANAKFNKQEVVKEAIAGSPLTETPNGTAVTPEVVTETPPPSNAPPAYNKSMSFFDNISSETKDRQENNGQKPGGREWRGEEQRKNMETFGQSSVDGGYRGYRGRGRGRGGRGRGGYSRGGRGGGAGAGGFRRENPVSQ